MRTSRCRVARLLLAFALACCCALARAEVIYFEDFSGSGTANLHGTPPETRPGVLVWSADWRWKADGSKAADGTGSAWVPFLPVPGNRYHLRLDVNPDVSDGFFDWFALGYGTAKSTGTWFGSPNQLSASMLNLADDTASNVVQTFAGPGPTGNANHDFDPDKVGPVTLEIVLDTTSPAWTAEWFADGASVRGPASLGAQPTIQHVGFGARDTATGWVDNFAVTVETNNFALVKDQVTVAVKATGDNHYEMYLSDSPNNRGTLIGRSSGDTGVDDWMTAEDFTFQMPTGETVYLHVHAINDDPPDWGGFIADLILQEHPAYVFAQTGFQRLVTTPDLWDMSTDGWGVNMTAARSLGTYGVEPWSTRVDPDLTGAAHWLWNAPANQGSAGELFFTVPLTVLVPDNAVPEPTALGLLLLGGVGLASRRRRR